VTQDGGFYDEISPLAGRGEGDLRLRNAIDLWATVLSRPEPEHAILDFGRRDAPFDQGMPRPTHWLSPDGREGSLAGARVDRLSDQHAHVRVDESAPLRIGDYVRCSVSHPCGAFDRWRVIPIVDRAGVVVDAVRTFF
jgi:D-serine deaminase-like pyridoxal phosphate-dependent protein